MKQTKHILATTLFLLLLGYEVGSAFAGKKVTICHIPPGNPDNAHTITVSENAVPAHMAHGDSFGECGSNSELSSPIVAIAGASFMICDDREGETGRLVIVNAVGRIKSERIKCD